MDATRTGNLPTERELARNAAAIAVLTERGMMVLLLTPGSKNQELRLPDWKVVHSQLMEPSSTQTRI